MVNTISEEVKRLGGIKNYLYLQQHKTLLRFLTCGSVDDGKSTLIGRLLHDTQHVYDDQISSLYLSSDRFDAIDEKKINLALLVDGLQAERMQGITIDVAYRYFFTQKRKFIIIDTPGHDEYTRNMITGASNSDVAILLVDACVGIRQQTRRHWFISILMGIKHIIIAVNKMDLVNYDQKVFLNISEKYLELNNKLSVDVNINFVPISALRGDNIIVSSKNMLWYTGPTLFEMLEDININTMMDIDNKKLRFPVQYIMRDNGNLRGYAGTVASGSIHIGQRIAVFPSYSNSSVKAILDFNKDRVNAVSGEAVTITLADDIDISRGDILIDAQHVISSTKNALVDVVWMHKKSLKIGQHFDVKVTTKFYRVHIKNILYQIDIHTFQRKDSDFIPFNGIGLVELLFEEPLILDQYLFYPVTGSMIFVDVLSNETVGAGMVKNTMLNSIIKNEKYSEFEIALHSLIRLHFPHWHIPDLL